MDRRHEIVTVDVHYVHHTDAAWKVRSVQTGITAWAPKSVCELEDPDGRDPRKVRELQIPEAMAVEKGLV